MHAMIDGKMHPEDKAKWVAALRSGEFKQGFGQLCTRKGDPDNGDVSEDRFCCLGVLNQILELGCKDDEAALWVEQVGGLRQKLPILTTCISSALIHMNDNKGKSFAQIADWIEANL